MSEIEFKYVFFVAGRKLIKDFSDFPNKKTIRQKQMHEKEVRARAAVEEEKTLYNRNREVMLEKHKQWVREEEALQRKGRERAAVIRSQIEENEARRLKARHDNFQSGIRWKDNLKREMDEIEEIKKEKADELLRQGVPHKYLADLLTFDPQKALIQDYKRGKEKW